MTYSIRCFLFISVVIFSGNTLYGQYCLGSFNYLESEYASSDTELILIEDDISFDDQELHFRNTVIALQTIEYIPFDSKTELKEQLGCFYDYADCDLVNGTIIKVGLAENLIGSVAEFTLLELYDCGIRRYKLLTDIGMYSCNSTAEIDRENSSFVTVYEKRASTYQKRYVTSADTNGYVDLAQPATFETVTEQVLEKQGYDSLILKEVVFDTTWISYVTETSNCPTAELESFTYEYLEVEAYNTYDLLPAGFSNTTETVLSNEEPDSLYYYKREWKDNPIKIKERSVTYLPRGFTATPAGVYFFEQLDLDSIVIPAVDTVIGPYLELCDIGYVAAGEYCYSNSLGSTYSYRERSYQTLSSPARALLNPLPEKYGSVTVDLILNKDSIESSCVISDTTFVAQLIVKEQASVELMEIPPAYTTIEYIKYVNPPILNVTPGANEIVEITTEIPVTQAIGPVDVYMPVMLEPCQKKIVIKALNERGYLDTLDPDDTTFYEAILQFQIDGEFHLGLISLSLIAITK